MVAGSILLLVNNLRVVVVDINVRKQKRKEGKVCVRELPKHRLRR